MSQHTPTGAGAGGSAPRASSFEVLSSAGSGAYDPVVDATTVNKRTSVTKHHRRRRPEQPSPQTHAVSHQQVAAMQQQLDALSAQLRNNSNSCAGGTPKGNSATTPTSFANAPQQFPTAGPLSSTPAATTPLDDDDDDGGDGDFPQIAVQSQSRSQSIGTYIPLGGVAGSPAVAASRAPPPPPRAAQATAQQQLPPQPPPPQQLHAGTDDGVRSPSIQSANQQQHSLRHTQSGALLNTSQSGALPPRYGGGDDAVSRTDTETKKRKTYRSPHQRASVTVIDAPASAFAATHHPQLTAPPGSNRRRSVGGGGLPQLRTAHSFVAPSDEMFTPAQRRGGGASGTGFGMPSSFHQHHPATHQRPLTKMDSAAVLSATSRSASALPMPAPDDDSSTPNQMSMSLHRRVHVSTNDAGEGPIGFNEEQPFVSVMDIVYILNTIACSIIAISAVNPRIEIEDTPGLFVVSLICFAFSTVFTGCWIALRFFVQSRRGDWEIVDRLPAIRAHYLRSWFAFDALTFVPIEWAFVVWRWDVFYIIQMKHLLRIARIVSLGSSGNPLRGSRIWYRFLSFCVAYALIIHILASGFGAVEELGYLDSLYWSVLTITSVGYGDVVPRTDAGKIYSIIAMLMGVLLIASMTAFGTSVLTTKDKLTEDTDERKSLMDAMLTYYDVPWEVRRDVIQMFPSVLEAQSENTFRNMSEAMPKFVARRVDAFARAKMLRTVPLFKSLPDTQLVLELSALMTRRFVPVGEYIVSQGDVGTEMFFIIRGVVEVLAPSSDDPDEEIVVASLRGGEFFGEIALLQDVVRTASVQAVTLTELLVLDKEHVSGTVLHQLAGLVAEEMRQRKEAVARSNAAANGLGESADPKAGGDDDDDDDDDYDKDDGADALNEDGGGAFPQYSNPFADAPVEESEADSADVSGPQRDLVGAGSTSSPRGRSVGDTTSSRQLSSAAALESNDDSSRLPSATTTTGGVGVRLAPVPSPRIQSQDGVLDTNDDGEEPEPERAPTMDAPI